MRVLSILTCVFMMAAPGLIANELKPEEEVCVLETSMGTMVIRFFEKDAPETVANFKKLVG